VLANVMSLVPLILLSAVPSNRNASSPDHLFLLLNISMIHILDLCTNFILHWLIDLIISTTQRMITFATVSIISKFSGFKFQTLTGF
jgi:hypothetical protein